METIIAQATPKGESAIALIRVSGSKCRTILKEACNYNNIIPRFSKLCSYCDSNNNELDQILVTFFEKGKSYTGLDSFEICCHGNPLISQLICEDLIKRGCRVATPGEFTKLSFINGKIDLSQAESVAQIISARNQNSLAAAQRNLRGELSNQLTSIQDKILNLQASIEAFIDFPEDDLGTEDHDLQRMLCGEVISCLELLLEHASKTTFLNKDIKVALIGLPNAGKSSLFNEILGKKRAIVHEKKGTTRDYLEVFVKCGKTGFMLIDTAGVHETKNDIESVGVELSYEQVIEADVVLWVVDNSLPYPPDLPKKFLDIFQEKHVILVRNKSDIESVGPFQKSTSFDEINISCKERYGIKLLEDTICNRIDELQRFENDEVLLIGERHKDLINKCLEDVRCFESQLSQGIGIEILSTYLKSSREYIDEMIGIKTNENMLDKLFGQFCIGK